MTPGQQAQPLALGQQTLEVAGVVVLPMLALAAQAALAS
jgi:hypothetical protein